MSHSLEAAYPSTFPAHFVQYCIDNEISAEQFVAFQGSGVDDGSGCPISAGVANRRYVRLRPGFMHLRESIDAQLESFPPQGHWRLASVPWLPCGAFCIPRVIPSSHVGSDEAQKIAVSSLDAYRSGALCCMDAASMASVVALQVSPGDRVLDLCCCPGMKLLLIADALRSAATSDGRPVGDVIGVDINLDRLLVARSLIRKYHSDDLVSLLMCDGTKVTDEMWLELESRCGAKVNDAKALERRVSNLKKYAVRLQKRERDICEREDKDVQKVPSCETAEWILRRPVRCSSAAAGDGERKFDKVLVDVECTHDGSMFHLNFQPRKEGASGALHSPSASSAGDALYQGITNEHRMDRMNVDDPEGLFRLQLELLTRGFEQLRSGGRLVYSTCSLSRRQNETIIERFVRNLHSEVTDGHARCRSVEPFPCDSDASAPHSVCPLLRCSSESSQAALRLACDLSTLTVELPAIADCMELKFAHFSPRRSKTSFQFLSVIEKL